MDIKPIFKALVRNPVGLILISLQVALTLAIIVNALFIINQRLALTEEHSGIDEKNTLMISMAGLSSDYNIRNAIDNDLAFLRGLPSVESAMASNTLPMSNSGWSSSVAAGPGDDAVSFSSGFYFADHTLVESLGVNLIAGRGFREEEITFFNITADLNPGKVIVSTELAFTLFPEIKTPEQALGKKLWSGSDEDLISAEIIGIVDGIKSPWRSLATGIYDKVIYVPHKPVFGNFSTYIVRAKPGEINDLLANIQIKLSDFDPQRIVRPPEAFSQIREDFFKQDTSMATMLTVVVGLLLVINALGIVGLVSFWVTQRTKQIGTRRALGATKFNILSYFLTENLIITCIGIAVGSILAMALNNWLVTEFSVDKLPLTYLISGALLLIVMGLLAVCAPAVKAVNVPPAVATRSV